MKRFLLAILLAAILIVPMSSPVLAASKPAKHTFTAEMTVGIVGSHDFYPDPVDPYNYVVGTFNYAGSVTDADRQSKDWDKLEGAAVKATENVRYLYQIHPVYGFILLSGTATGTVTITGSDHSVAVMTFNSVINWGASGALEDVGTWKAKSATGFMRILKDSEGTWTAIVDPLTFTGIAYVAGTFQNLGGSDRDDRGGNDRGNDRDDRGNDRDNRGNDRDNRGGR